MIFREKRTVGYIPSESTDLDYDDESSSGDDDAYMEEQLRLQAERAALENESNKKRGPETTKKLQREHIFFLFCFFMIISKKITR